MITDANLTLSAHRPSPRLPSARTRLTSANRDIGAGEELNVYINVRKWLRRLPALRRSTSKWWRVDNANLSTPTILGQTDAIPKASLVVGNQITFCRFRCLL
jgi:hypothetical protein